MNMLLNIVGVALGIVLGIVGLAVLSAGIGALVGFGILGMRAVVGAL